MRSAITSLNGCSRRSERSGASSAATFRSGSGIATSKATSKHANRGYLMVAPVSSPLCLAGRLVSHKPAPAEQPPLHEGDQSKQHDRHYCQQDNRSEDPVGSQTSAGDVDQIAKTGIGADIFTEYSSDHGDRNA